MDGDHSYLNQRSKLISSAFFRFFINGRGWASAMPFCNHKAPAGGGGGVLPYMGYIGMCGPKGYGFSAVLVINRVSNLADSGHK